MTKAKRLGAILLALLLTVSTLWGTVSTAYAADEPDGYVVMSVEKLTLGQGFIMEPQRVPYYKGENLAKVLDRALTSIGREYEYTRSLEDGFYLAAVEDPDRPSIGTTIPSYILDMWAAAKAVSPNIKAIAHTDTSDPDFLGEFDYYSQSGWMISVNNSFPPVGAAAVNAANGLVVRWQFSLIGLGGDLGGGGTTAAGNVEHMNRTELYTVLAAVRADKYLMEDETVKAAYDKALELSRDITINAEDVQTYLDTMKKALGDNQITEVKLSANESGVRSYAYGTTLEEASQGLPTYLLATIDGENKIITDVTWALDSEFGAPGTYQFRPVLPEKYSRCTLTAELPMMRVTVLPPTGDMNGDALLDVRDISRMAASAGRTDRAICDLDDSGTVAWNDFRLLLNTLGDSVLATTNAPETVLAVDFDKTSYQKGDTAIATIRTPEASFDTFSTLLTYDADKLAFQSLRLTEPLMETAMLETEGSLRFGGASLEGAAQSDVIAKVTFTVLADGPAEAQTAPEQTALLLSGYYVNVSATDRMALLAMPEVVLYGDLNGDGEIDITDAGLLIQYCNGMRELTEEQLAAADLNDDGEASLADAALLVQYCNGLINSFPVSINDQKFVLGGD